MGLFRREGSFSDRAAFVQELRSRIERLRTRSLPSLVEAWTRDDGRDLCRLEVYGVTLEFHVRERDWHCEAVLPDWLPIPQRVLEEKFDAEFASVLRHR